MTSWIRRGAAALCGLSLAAMLLSTGARGAAAGAALAGLLWSVGDRLPTRLFGALNACMLLCSTGATALLVLRGASTIHGAITSALTLLAWNAGLFVVRWPNAARDADRRYLMALAKPIILGLLLGVSCEFV